MTKGGSGKPKTLGRLIFGEKRKPHTSPTRHQSATRNGGSMVELPTSSPVTTNKNPINIHDWAVWRMQLNEQMGGGLVDRRTEIKQMRQFLQSNPFYQQHSRDPSTGRCNGVRLLFSIPHAKIKPELLDGSRRGISKSNSNEVGEPSTHEQKKIRSNSGDQTASVTSTSAVQPTMVIDKTISLLFPKGLVENTGGFLQINEQMVAADGIRPRRAGRSSFRASDKIHSTLQKAVKDGNVLEKIKAFEMQAAAAQAESTLKLGGANHRMQNVTSTFQSVAQRTLSPAIIHSVQQPISPIPVQQQPQQPIRSNRSRNDHPVQQQRDSTHGPIVGPETKKGAHVLEPAHGDIILRRRTPSQKNTNDEDYSITAITSMAMTGSQGHHHHHRNQHPHHQHHRTSASRSRHRQEMVYDKRTPSANEYISHKHQQKQKRTTTPTAKSSSRRRWLKGRKETPTETPIQADKKEIPTGKSSKSSKSKKKNSETEKIDSKKPSTSSKKGKSSSDNSRVYGVPNPDTSEHTKIESSTLQSPPPPTIEEESEYDPDKDNTNTNTYMAPKDMDFSQYKKSETIQQRSSKKSHQQKLSSTDGQILSKNDEDTRVSRPTDDHVHHSALNNDVDKSDDDVFIEDTPIKSSLNITRHQSVINLSNNESRRLQQQSSHAIRRHASQCSADDFLPHDRRYQRSKEHSEFINVNTLEKKSSPLTLITRKNQINQDEPIVYETPHSEQTLAPICNTHTLKKKRPFHTITAPGISSTKGQTNNKQISKQILHAIMNSMNNNNNQEQVQISPRPISSSVTDEFFDNGPLTNPEETIDNLTVST